MIPLVFLVILAGIFALLSFTAPGLQQSVSPPPPVLNTANSSVKSVFRKLTPAIIACYTSGAYSRAQPLLLARLSEDNFDDCLFLGGFYRDWTHWAKSRYYYDLAVAQAEADGNQERIAIAANDLGLLLTLQTGSSSGQSRSDLLAQGKDAFAKATDAVKKTKNAQLAEAILRNEKVLLSLSMQR